MVTNAEYWDLASAQLKASGQPDYALAARLIGRNREYAAAGDPNIMGKIKYLKAHSYIGLLRSESIGAAREGATLQDIKDIQAGVTTTTIKEIPQTRLTATSFDELPINRSALVDQQVSEWSKKNPSPSPKRQFYWFDLPEYAATAAYNALPESNFKKFMNTPAPGIREISRNSMASMFFAPVLMTTTETMSFYNRMSPAVDLQEPITFVSKSGKGYRLDTRTVSINQYGDETVSYTSAYAKMGKNGLTISRGKMIMPNSESNIINLYDVDTLTKTGSLTAMKGYKGNYGVSLVKQTGKIKGYNFLDNELVRYENIKGTDISTSSINYVSKKPYSQGDLIAYRYYGSSILNKNVGSTGIDLSPKAINIKGLIVFKSSDIGKSISNKGLYSFTSKVLAPKLIQPSLTTSLTSSFSSAAYKPVTSILTNIKQRPIISSSNIKITKPKLNNDIIYSTPKTGEITKLSFDYGQVTKDDQSSRRSSRTRQAFDFGNINKQLPDIDTGFKDRVNQNTDTSTRQDSGSNQRTKYKFKFPKTPSPPPVIGFGFDNPPDTPDYPKLKFTRLAGLDLPSNIFTGGKQKKAYTPSPTAIFKNISGAKPKGVETGIRFRPILLTTKKRRKK